MKRLQGFTLIELMIGIAIVGILAAIAYPNYQNYVVKGNRAAAKSFLLEVAQKEQQYLMDARAYALDASAATRDALASNKLNMGSPVGTPPPEVSRFYTVTVTNNAGGYTATTPLSFQVKATPIAGMRQAKANDGWLQIDNTGAKTSQYPDKW